MTDARATRRRENVGTGFIVVATLVSAVAVLVFQAIGSRALGTDGFAPIAALWTVVFLIYTVLQLPAEQHLTRALVVTRDRAGLRRVRRDMLVVFAAAVVTGTAFVVVTLDRFFEGDARFIAVTAVIMATRSLMATARGTVAGHRRFGAYGGTVALEGAGLFVGAVVCASLDASALGFTVIMALAPLTCLLVRPFADVVGEGHIDVEAQPGSFLAWLVASTFASQLIIAGGPIAVSFVGGTATAVSVFFTSFALLRGPVTSAYNLVARVLPDFTTLAHGDDPHRLWAWAPRLTIGGAVVAVFGAVGSGLLLQPIIELVYGESFVPPDLAAILGGAGVGLGLGALFATQIYTASARGALLAAGWYTGLIASLAVLVFTTLEPIDRVALAFTVGEAAGLMMLGLILPAVAVRTARTAGGAGADIA